MNSNGGHLEKYVALKPEKLFLHMKFFLSKLLPIQYLVLVVMVFAVMCKGQINKETNLS